MKIQFQLFGVTWSGCQSAVVWIEISRENRAKQKWQATKSDIRRRFTLVTWLFSFASSVGNVFCIQNVETCKWVSARWGLGFASKSIDRCETLFAFFCSFFSVYCSISSNRVKCCRSNGVESEKWNRVKAAIIGGLFFLPLSSHTLYTYVFTL